MEKYSNRDGVVSQLVVGASRAAGYTGSNMSPYKLFTEHPATVGETYFEHLGAAAGFAGWMLLATLACSIHAIFPFLCVTTGSSIIKRLHDRMVVNRARIAGGASALNNAS
jgi:hypothetical protein